MVTMFKKIKILLILYLFTSFILLSAGEIKYPFIYIPGMFDNGDMLNSNYLLVKNLNNKDGYYYNNYFNNEFNYENDIIFCSSNIVNSKYNRLVVANLIGKYRTNIDLDLMSDRLFALIQGKAPKFKNYKLITNHFGNDYSGYAIRSGKKIYFFGLLEEIWLKYGKKIYLKKYKDGYKVLLYNTNQKENNFCIINNNYYFNSPEEIKFNVVAHSSGGLAIRKYISICEKEKLPHGINLIINLSVPQKGARMNYALKNAFPELLKISIESVFNKKQTGKIEITEINKTYNYEEIIKKTNIDKMHENNKTAYYFRKIIGDYILYHIPFDGYKNVLGKDPALYDLHPDHKFIRELNKSTIPSDIEIFNFRVKSPYAKMFKNIGTFLNLTDNDGVVDFDDTSLINIKNYKELKIKDYIVEKANHIPFPYIKPLYELRETITKYYPFLKIMVKKNVSKVESINIIQAMMLAIMNEFGLNLDYLLKNENYSVIDYFAENPIEL